MVGRLFGRLCLAFAGAMALGLPGAAAFGQPTSTAAAVQSVFLLSNAKSREIGPENLTGEPGMGGRTELKDGSAKFAAQ